MEWFIAVVLILVALMAVAVGYTMEDEFILGIGFGMFASAVVMVISFAIWYW